MIGYLANDKVKYEFFDRSFKESSHRYRKCPIEEIESNCVAISTYLGGKAVVLLRQVHSTKVLYVTKSFEIGVEPEIDAVITDQPGLILAIQTADCVPILLSCETGKIIGAAHAGWKGARQGIIENVVREMQAKGAKNIHIVIGPSIQQQSYEVDRAYYEEFMTEDTNNEHFFVSVADKFLFDLPAYIQKKLRALGIENILHHRKDTYAMTQKYYSYRRACHTGTGYEGSLVSAIMIYAY